MVGRLIHDAALNAAHEWLFQRVSAFHAILRQRVKPLLYLFGHLRRCEDLFVVSKAAFGFDQEHGLTNWMLARRRVSSLRAGGMLLFRKRAQQDSNLQPLVPTTGWITR
jgi:hypothetical protein